jgi:transposase
LISPWARLGFESPLVAYTQHIALLQRKRLPIAVFLQKYKYPKVVPITFLMEITLDTDTTAGNRKGRPNYPADVKQRLAIEACALGISVSKLAQQNNINANLLFTWRRELRAGLFEPVAPALLPVLIKPAPTRMPSPRAADSPLSK